MHHASVAAEGQGHHLESALPAGRSHLQPLRHIARLSFTCSAMLVVTSLLWLLTGHASSPRVALGRGLRVSVQDEPAEPADQGSATRDRAPQPQRTRMQCLGTETLTRACHFQNVYYDLSSARFVHYGIDGATSEVFGDDLDRELNDPWLRLIWGNESWLPGGVDRDNQFYMDWRAGEPLPAAEAVVTFERPLHLRSPFNTKSIGHLLRDNLQFLVDLPLRFGRDPIDFDWVRWHSVDEWCKWEEESTTAEHYRGLINNRPSLTWQQVLDQALKGKEQAGVKYICFAELIAGQGPADFSSQVGSLDLAVTTERMAGWAHMCDPFPFTAMRQVAYRNFGMEVASVHELEPFVLFLDGQPKERRHLVNAPELLPKLKKAFPGVRMEHLQISKLPLESQLELLSKATVMVSNIGSRSFRLIYLPNGATTILVGPPEYEFEILPSDKDEPFRYGFQTVDKVTPWTIRKPFLEIDWCWGYIGYVNMLRYRVQTEAEVKRKKPWTSWKDARNTDIVLDERKITSLIHLALERTQHSTAQHGTGQLSAYNS